MLRRDFMGATGLAVLAGSLPAAARPQSEGAVDTAQWNAFGPEADSLAARTGRWAVVETVWDGPDAKPVATRGLIAERVMMGSLLHELIRSPEDGGVKRLDTLCYNRVEGRWDYASFDTRAPVGLMPAYSLGRGQGGVIDLAFLPFAIAGCCAWSSRSASRLPIAM